MTEGGLSSNTRTGQPRESLFEQRAHRWPVEAEPMAYAMACIEVVLEKSEQAARAFRDLVFHRSLQATESERHMAVCLDQVPTRIL